MTPKAKKITIVSVAILIIVSALVAFYFYGKNKEEDLQAKQLESKKQLPNPKIKELLANVKKGETLQVSPDKIEQIKQFF